MREIERERAEHGQHMHLSLNSVHGSVGFNQGIIKRMLKGQLGVQPHLVGPIAIAGIHSEWSDGNTYWPEFYP